MSIFVGVKCEGCGRIALVDDPLPKHRCSSCGEALKITAADSGVKGKDHVAVNKYGNFWRRLAAGAFDAVLLSFSIYLLNELFLLLPQTAYNAIIVILFLLPPFYFVFGHYKYGQTAGKKILGIKVTSINEDELMSF